MSRFIPSNSFKNMKIYDIPIQVKKSKNKKPNNPSQNKKIDLGISDKDFEQLMNEQEIQNNNSYEYILPDPTNLSDNIKKILSSGLLGDSLVVWVKLNQIEANGEELMSGLLINNESTNINIFSSKEYGAILKYLLDSNEKSQLICLILIQNYAKSCGLIKIPYKNSLVYQIKLLFNLLFINEIIDESAYWKWQEYIGETNELDDKTKNTLLIQTSDFFSILQTVFNEEDEGEEVEDSNHNELDEYFNHKKSNNTDPNKNDLEQNDESSESEDNEYKVPEEQDYNMEDF